jgi:hypothetical protein
LLLDMQDDPAASTGWLSDPQLADLWVGEAKDTDDGPIEGSDTGWKEHLAELRLASEKAPTLGPPPGDLFIVLARAAVAGPANASLRALSRLTGGRNAQREAILRTSAARMAWGFRSLFNIPEVMALLRGLNAVEPYWQRVLEYCVDGDLSAVLEEYVHVLRESLGLVDRNRFEAAAAIADHVAQVLSLRTSVLGADDIRGLRSGRLLMEKRRIRTRFAMRFGEQTTDEAESGQAGSGQVAQKTRGDQVRSAFNSPFWPFVLTSTSVGQEGLDFHQYCHAVVHWNLPSNPVDLEQREGRVHRYKGHAVRKNVARTAGSVGVAADATREAADPWEVMFGIVHRSRRSDESELVPFWVYPVEGGAKIERYVPALPLSREITQYAALRRALTVYRMAFGQPRQEDLVAYLLRTIPTEAVTTLLSRIQIDLAPPSRREPTDPRGIATAESADVWSAASARIRHGGAKSSVIERPRTVEALAAARRNPETGRRVLEMLFPDVSLRRAMELQLVASIRAAHDVNAQSWAVTLLANDNIYVRLNVGGIEVLRLDRRETDRLMLVVRVSALDRLLKEELRSRDMLQSGAPFSTEPHARLVYLRDAEIAAWAPRVTAAHLSMVRLAASHVRTQTAALKQHSPGIVEYLRGVGLEVPGASAT